MCGYGSHGILLIFLYHSQILLSPRSRPSPSPTRTPLSPTQTGSSAGLFGGRYAQIAPRGESGRIVNGILSQLTGGTERSTSPVRTHVTGGPPRSSSPVRRQVTGGIAQQFTGDGVPVTRPRPRSVIGNRSIGNAGEGRGMFLVRQMTGTTG